MTEEAPDTVRPPELADLPPLPETIPREAVEEIIRMVRAYHSEFRAFRRTFAEWMQRVALEDADRDLTLRQVKNVVQAALLLLPAKPTTFERQLGYDLLVVDDDRAILTAFERSLTSSGVRVTGAMNAESAKARLGHQAFHVAIVDVNLPDESGIDLVAWMLDAHPNVAPILMSGYSRDIVESDLLTPDLRSKNIAILEKPFVSKTALVDSIVKAVTGAEG